MYKIIQITLALLFVMLLGKQSSSLTVERDQYNRSVAQVLIDGDDLALKLVSQGYAWIYPQYLHQCSNAGALSSAQKTAQQQKLGVHSETVMLPSEFRKAVAKMQ